MKERISLKEKEYEKKAKERKEEGKKTEKRQEERNKPDRATMRPDCVTAWSETLKTRLSIV